jgi:uncharacterized membrane protein YjdF
LLTEIIILAVLVIGLVSDALIYEKLSYRIKMRKIGQNFSLRQMLASRSSYEIVQWRELSDAEFFSNAEIKIRLYQNFGRGP